MRQHTILLTILLMVSAKSRLTHWMLLPFRKKLGIAQEQREVFSLPPRNAACKFCGKGAVSVMCYMRAIQLYVFTAFSPIPFALLGFDETKNYGISFCKNYLGICLSGAVIILALSAFPSLLSGFSGGEITGIKGEMWGSLCAVLAMTLIIIKSGTIARDILGG